MVMMHGGEPWTFLAWKLMLKWPGLHYMTSAFAPKHYPKDIIDFANTRGRTRFMYCGYFRRFDPRAAVPRHAQRPFNDGVWPKFLRENAIRVFKLPTLTH